MLQDFFFLRRRQEFFFFSTIEVLLPSQLHRSFDNTTTVEGVRLLFSAEKKMQKVNYSCDPYLFLSNENRDKSIERVVTSHWPKSFFYSLVPFFYWK